MSPKTNKKPNDVQRAALESKDKIGNERGLMKVGDKVRFIPVANCTCIHCCVNMSGFNTLFIVMGLRGQRLSLCERGSTYREWLTYGQITVASDHVKRVA